MNFPFKLARKKEFDVVGFGTNAVDHLIVVPEYPAFNSKVEFEEHIQLSGGEIASTMAGLQRLGIKTAYVGRFGNDHEGDIGFRSLGDEGVDMTFAEQIEGARTQAAFILIDRQSGERTIIWKRDEKLAISAEDVPTDIAGRTRIFHATPHDTLACIAMAKEAKANGAIISIDIDNVFDGLTEMIPLIDIFISSAEFPEKLVGVDDRRAALREIQMRFGCGVVGMTLGDQGSLILCGDGFIETRGYAVPGGCRDTTGAGDAFRVGFLYGLLKGESVETAAEMANAVAALKCREIGARTALPGAEDLKEFLRR